MNGRYDYYCHKCGKGLDLPWGAARCFKCNTVHVFCFDCGSAALLFQKDVKLCVLKDEDRFVLEMME